MVLGVTPHPPHPPAVQQGVEVADDAAQAVVEGGRTADPGTERQRRLGEEWVGIGRRGPHRPFSGLRVFPKGLGGGEITGHRHYSFSFTKQWNIEKQLLQYFYLY